MTGRSNWYGDHPPACTCWRCNEGRGNRRDRRPVRTATRERRPPQPPRRPPTTGTPSPRFPEGPRRGGKGYWHLLWIFPIGILGLTIWNILDNQALLDDFDGGDNGETASPAFTPTQTRNSPGNYTPTPTQAPTPSPSTPVSTPVITRTATPTRTPTPVPTLVATPDSAPTPTSTPIPTMVVTPSPTPKPTPVTTSSPTPVPTPTPVSTPVDSPTSAPLDELSEYALELINADRIKHGVAPVVLGTNIAAQAHAEDMLEHEYGGHWWTNGMKPYMVYSVTGGKSYVSENSSWSGWTLRQWREENCDSFLVRCHVPSPREAIEELHWSMMYDDADSDWGHRDNILDEYHRTVNIGIAANGRRVTFIQHFEGGDVEAVKAPTVDKDGTFSLVLSKKVHGLDIGRVASIYYDPLPIPMTPAQIDALDSYCLGGGATTRCGDPVVRILPPPGPGRYYAQLDSNEVVALVWEEDDDSFQVSAKIGPLLTRPGVYTVVIWRDSGTNLFSDPLLTLSILPKE